MGHCMGRVGNTSLCNESEMIECVRGNYGTIFTLNIRKLWFPVEVFINPSLFIQVILTFYSLFCFISFDDFFFQLDARQDI